MAATSGVDLRSLKERPFDLLRELERRSKAALAGAAGHGEIDTEEWVGIGFKLGDESFVIDRKWIREVMLMPSFVTRVPGAKSWVKGLANVRGHLVPIIELKSFLGAGASFNTRDCRVLVINTADLPIGLVVDEVYGFRRFLEREQVEEVPQTEIRCEHYLEGSYTRGAETWPVFSMERLLRSDEFLRAAAEH